MDVRAVRLARSDEGDFVVRILCIADDCPWPQHSGRRVRLANIILALGTLGTVDCFVVLNDARADPSCDAPNDVPSDVGVDRLHVVHDRAPTAKLGRPLRWATSRRPFGMLWRPWSTARAELRRFAGAPYDLVWFGRAESFLALHDVVTGARVVVDFDDLEDQRLRHRLARHGAVGSRRRRWLRGAVDRIDLRRWARAQRRVAATVDAVAVCSELDERRLGAANAFVLPNGYELLGAGAARPAGRGGPPVIVMVGVFTYEPNVDGASWFVDDVLPIIQQRLGPVELRLVGPPPTASDGLEGRPGVRIMGIVPDIRVELERADIEIVPIRSGGGTRVKLLEAFAYRVPVVSTSIGAEGIDAGDGVHLLVADEPDAFADACVQLLSDRPLADRLTAAGFELWQSRYQWADLRSALTDRLRAVASPTPGSTMPDGRMSS
jgi:polysaccharide biosynthesis protein PslH